MKVNRPALNVAFGLGIVSQSLNAAPIQTPTAANPQKIIRDEKQIDKVTQRIIDILKTHILTHDIDRASVDKLAQKDSQEISGLETLAEKIRSFVVKGKRIETYMIGFPFKSSNRDKKTISHLPDMAERAAFVHLNKLLSHISKIYPEGIRLTIICDGATFCDVLGIPDQYLVDYERSLCQLVSDIPSIRIITSAHLRNNMMPIAMLRNVIDHTEPKDEDIEQKLSSDPAMQQELETTLKRIALELDHEKGKRLIAREGLENITKNIVKRSLRFGNFIKSHFPEYNNYIKFSVHYQMDVSKKVGIKLSEHSNITPWHGVFVREADGTTSFKHKMDIDLNHYEIASESIHGVWCPYFKAKT